MRVAVYNRWWSTAGGGERVAAAIAQVLAAEHEVTLLGHEPVDLPDLSERIHVDLSGCEFRSIEIFPSALEEAGAGFDLLVNCSYSNDSPSTAKSGIYYVHFPHKQFREPVGLRGMAIKGIRPLVKGSSIPVEEVGGLHPDEPLGRRRTRWTDGKATLNVLAPPSGTVPIRVDLGRFQPPEIGPIPVKVTADGRPVTSCQVTPLSSRFEKRTESVHFEIVGHSDQTPVEIVIESPTFVPADHAVGQDCRRLGVPYLGTVAGKGFSAQMLRRFPSLADQKESVNWLESYDCVLANSEYTREWIERWWGIDSKLLSPPVRLMSPGEKTNTILSVGRFFDSHAGHSKKQLEIVQAFQMLFEGGTTDWTLHLVGGCDHDGRAYLERVRYAAKGLPIEIHENATGSELRDLYSEASIYWHAAGFGEDPDAHPERFEHFGIATVEAMSAGAVPCVLGAAGQEEVVSHAVTGYHFQTLDQLVRLTEHLIQNPDLRHLLAEDAVEAAQRYGFREFASTLTRIVEKVTAI